MIDSFCDLLKTCYENDLKVEISKESDRTVLISITKTFESKPGHCMRSTTTLDPLLFELMKFDATRDQVIFSEIENNIFQMMRQELEEGLREKHSE